MAAFLYNFLSFVEWPPSAFLDEGPLLIGVLGANPFGDATRSIEKREVNRRPIRFLFFDRVDALRPTHILFVTPEFADRLKEVRRTLRGQPVLLVGESENFTRSGGMIRFYDIPADRSPSGERQVRIEINEGAARAGGLDIRSKLLRLSDVVNHPVPESDGGADTP